MDKLSDLTRRDVINIMDGRRLGYVEDVELDVDEGHITAIVVPGAPRLLGLFGRERDLIIPWDRILRIGEDVILVELSDRSRVRRRKGERYDADLS